MLGPQVQGRELGRRAQTFGADLALGAQLQTTGLGAGAAWRRAHAAVKAHRAPQHARLQTAQAETGLGELHAALQLFKQGRGRGDAQLIALQHHSALHFDFFRLGQGHRQLEAGLQQACGLRLGKCA